MRLRACLTTPDATVTALPRIVRPRRSALIWSTRKKRSGSCAAGATIDSLISTPINAPGPNAVGRMDGDGLRQDHMLGLAQVGHDQAAHGRLVGVHEVVVAVLLAQTCEPRPNAERRQLALGKV